MKNGVFFWNMLLYDIVRLMGTEVSEHAAIIQLSQLWALSIVLPTILDDSKAGFSFRLQMESTLLGPIDTASLCLRTPATTLPLFIEPNFVGSI
jgi:hypothetical protein